MLLLGGGMALADTPDCNPNTAGSLPVQLISPPTLGAPAAFIGSTPLGWTENGLGADGSTAYSCSLQITIPQGQKRVVLVEGWFYRQSDYPGDCQGCDENDVTVTVTGLAETYTSAQTGHIYQPPSGPWIKWPDSLYYEGSRWYLNKFHVFDVSSLTASKPLPLTLQVQIKIKSPDSNDWGGDWWNPLGVTVGLLGGTRFTLSQTQPSFRPRDARDPAAYCTQADATGQQHDGDCHPQFKVTLTGLESYGPGWAGIISPSIAFTLTAATPLAAAGTWLQGTSTNYGTDAVTDPDYIFEASKQTAANLTVEGPLSMVANPGSFQTGTVYGTDPQKPDGVPSPTVSMPITVTSQDFGGKAYLRAALTLGPGASAIDAEIVDPVTGLDVKAPVAGTKCGTDFAAHPFASLPVDQDCNGIADSWEKPFAQALLGQDFFPDPSADLDRGALGKDTPLPQFGDGLSVHDEYRGFHVLDPQTGNAKWIATDPGRPDLFYWDADHIGRTRSDRVGTGVFNSILGATTSAFMDIHPVDALLSNGNRAAKDIKEARAINKNTIYPQHKAYAVIYVNKPLDPGKTGKSGAAMDDYAFTNAGTPILIDKSQITSTEGKTWFQSGTLLAQTIAHETGHKLSRQHPLRCANTPVAYDPSQAGFLTVNQFMQNGAHLLDLYARYKVYSFNGIHKRETAFPPGEYQIAESSETPLPGTIVPPDWTYKIRAKPNGEERNLPALTELAIQTQEGLMMDWTPDLTFTTPGTWNWASRDINALCFQPNGCKTPQTAWPGCSILWQ
jgi:hypothetical protein